MSSAKGHSVLVVVLAVAMILGLSSAPVLAQCRSRRSQNRSPQRFTLQTTSPQYSMLQTTSPQYSMLTALQQQNAVLAVLQQQYAMLVSLQQQFAVLAARRQSAVRTESYIPRSSDLTSNASRTELIVISSGRSTTLSTSGDTDTGLSSTYETANRKLNLAQMLADAGLAKRFQGKSDEANQLLQRARLRFQEIVATYGNTSAAAEARKKLAALADS
jgi:DNA-binding NarL/FixJ family response regulator